MIKKNDRNILLSGIDIVILSWFIYDKVYIKLIFCLWGGEGREGVYLV